MGIRWVDLTDDDRAALREYLDQVKTQVSSQPADAD